MRNYLGVFLIWLVPLVGVQADDYPTLDRVEYVLTCMQEQGGQTYDTLYACVCMIDQIAAHINYTDFAEAETFQQLRSTPGERGGIFRDPARASELPDKLQQVTKTAEATCFLRKGG